MGGAIKKGEIIKLLSTKRGYLLRKDYTKTSVSNVQRTRNDKLEEEYSMGGKGIEMVIIIGYNRGK